MSPTVDRALERGERVLDVAHVAGELGAHLEEEGAAGGRRRRGAPPRRVSTAPARQPPRAHGLDAAAAGMRSVRVVVGELGEVALGELALAPPQRQADAQRPVAEPAVAAQPLEDRVGPGPLPQQRVGAPELGEHQRGVRIEGERRLEPADALLDGAGLDEDAPERGVRLGEAGAPLHRRRAARARRPGVSPCWKSTEPSARCASPRLGAAATARSATPRARAMPASPTKKASARERQRQAREDQRVVGRERQRLLEELDRAAARCSGQNLRYSCRARR